MRKMRKNEDAFTGLEAAIVLIAFVVVAAVFSYVVLGAGFFTTQKSQEVVHSGVTQAASNIVVKGEVYGISTTPGEVNKLRFDVGLAAGGLPVDIARSTLVMSTKENVSTLSYNSETTDSPGANNWSISGKSTGASDDTLLQSDETFTIYVQPPTSIPLYNRTTFNLEIKPEVGASLGIQRTIPAGVTNVTLLY
ncbi:flagellin FlaB [Methanolinea mesophila]|uniref:archaellin/type IV pilin N-terminal domain-containing protein n=1 Tax=Methanolinea mesophila TaxID=547055 RepID=UPI001AE98939|nr:archaellin/type IV pilin N-terminal domain-containing protein [Methanolinea mesophila]MBP1927894.1 flagellin FlaB [Methanolinea mesophila]